MQGREHFDLVKQEALKQLITDLHRLWIIVRLILVLEIAV